jgi:hypothetical protein
MNKIIKAVRRGPTRVKDTLQGEMGDSSGFKSYLEELLTAAALLFAWAWIALL